MEFRATSLLPSLFRRSKRILSAPVVETATLVAIAKNEDTYIPEWIAHHLAVGFSKIIVYDDSSTDATLEVLKNISQTCDAVRVKAVGSVGIDESPQTTSYNDALQEIQTDWTMFLDIDEFLVPYRDYSIGAYLMRAPSDVSSVHVNWRGFGSSGLTTKSYDLVVEAFTRCAPPSWSNHYHFKSIARTALIEKVYIHNLDTTSGRRVLSDFGDFETLNNGMSNRIAYDGIQINHYQSKTYEEFRARMERGDANYHPSHELKRRDGSYDRFSQIDRNEEEDYAASVFKARFERFYAQIGAQAR